MDSGASCNVLRFEHMQSLNKKVALTSTERSLRMYDGSVTKPLGMCVISVKNPRTSVKRELEFMIMRQAPVSLLGCAASQAMGLLSIHTENIQLNRVDTSATTPSMNESCSVQDLLKEYHDVFDGELGCLPGVEHLEVNTSIQPVKMLFAEGAIGSARALGRGNQSSGSNGSDREDKPTY